MAENVLFSIITICYNAENEIAATMESVLHQKYDSYEYILKDGDSKDSTNNIITDELQKLDHPENYVRHVVSTDSGIYDAMNQAVKLSSGEWIAFMNAGDAYCDNLVLSRVAEVAKNSCADVIYGNAVVFDEAGQNIWVGDISTIKKHMPFCHQACFVRRQLLIDNPFDLNFKIGADYNFIATVYEKGKSFKKIDFNIASFGLDGVSSTKYVAKAKEQQKILYTHRFVKHYYSAGYARRMCEAAIKACMDRFLPYKFRCWMKNIYKVKVKHYEKLTE